MLGWRVRSAGEDDEAEVYVVKRRAALAVVTVAGLLAGACAHAPRAATPAAPAATGRTTPATDPVTRAVSEADQLLARGLAEAQEGHLQQARASFDRAVDVYLAYPGGAYADARLGEAYRRTLETIHLRDLEALAAGDGFTESQAEPASIDEVASLPVDDQVPSEETRRTAEAAVKGEVNDLPIALNDRVLACIDLYQGRLRTWFSEALVRGGRYLPYIRRVFAEEGIPQDLAYTALVESAFKNTALSRAKARGMWQFIPATGKRFGLQQDWWVDERGDFEKATRAAARYLKELHGIFGDWNLALAAYNAGESKIMRGIERHQVYDFWSLAQTSAIRRETKNYVPMIHAAIVVAKAPESYGFSPQADPELAFERVTVAGAVDLRAVAECSGASLDDLRTLNPALRRLATPSGRKFDVRVPAGTAAAAGRCLEELPAEKRASFRTHVVARGQTFSSIARRYGTRPEDIAQANGLSLRRPLARGTELIIPIPTRPVPAAPTAQARASLPATSTGSGAGGGGDRIRYRIRPGDTLGAIADRYGVTVREIQAWNGLRGTRIAAGGLLTLYTRR